MATGVLVLGLERATKLLNHLVLSDKSYLATIRLGAATSTDDAEGEVTYTADASFIRPSEIQAAMLHLTGEIMQRPSSVSAIKVAGQRAYDRVRAGELVELVARPVTVTRFELIAEPQPSASFLDLDVIVDCSSGTYVRALARDLGEALGTGGHLVALRRSRVGPFTLAEAVTLETLAALADPIVLPLPDAIAVAMPVRTVSADEARELSFGRTIQERGLTVTYGALDEHGAAVALLQDTGGRARPVLGFTPAG
jgi:tRNA pseudouridine55 synthase